jgi:general nucleoside transport system permease protein
MTAIVSERSRCKPAHNRRARPAGSAPSIEAILIPLGALVASARCSRSSCSSSASRRSTFFSLIWTGGFGSAFSIQNTLQRAAPLILTGLAFAIPARIGLTLIGGEGALVLGGFAAAASPSRWSRAAGRRP